MTIEKAERRSGFPSPFTRKRNIKALEAGSVEELRIDHWISRIPPFNRIRNYTFYMLVESDDRIRVTVVKKKEKGEEAEALPPFILEKDQINPFMSKLRSISHGIETSYKWVEDKK